MNHPVFRDWWRLARGLLAGCALGHFLVTADLTAGPLLLALAMALLLGWFTWGELSLPRVDLPESAATLQDWVAVLAALADLPTPRITVVAAASGAFDPPESLNLAGEVVFATGDLETHELSHHLAQAARQLAVAQAPPRYSAAGLLASGVGLGLLTGLLQRSGGAWWAALLAIGGLFALGALIVARGTSAQELRGQRIEQRARELLGLLRDRHPEAFADLLARQGLAPAASDLIQLQDHPTPPRACDHDAPPPAG
ncbi:MAG: hypothetical protein IT204_11710 [Fimbriimonadaceae bacterium]|nr:hypothetical protein [Fimbriimonadaceae bacterium]